MTALPAAVVLAAVVLGADPALAAAAADKDPELASRPEKALVEILRHVFAATKRPIAAFQHKGRAERLAFSPDGRVLASWSTYDDIRLSDPRTGRLLHKIPLPGYAANSLAFSPGGKVLAAGTNWGRVHLWDANTLRLRRSLLVARCSIYAVALSPDGTTLAACAGDGTVQVCNYRTARKLRAVGAKGERMGAMAFSADGRLLAAGNRNGKVEIWPVPRVAPAAAPPAGGGIEPVTTWPADTETPPIVTPPSTAPADPAGKSTTKPADARASERGDREAIARRKGIVRARSAEARERFRVVERFARPPLWSAWSP